MKPNYKNWVPKGMVYGCIIGAVVSFIGFLIFGIFGFAVSGVLKIILGIIFALAFIILLYFSVWSVIAYNAFSYNGKRQLSSKIVNGIAQYINIPNDGIGLDVGCGSGALTIACAKRNPNAKMFGIDYWGKEYASYSKVLCEENAVAEGVTNTNFKKGNAIKLEFDDETFDVVTSNYVYHNITGSDKQKLLLESLRVLKKGGQFVIHDIMSPSRYGNMVDFVNKLKDMGYEKVEMIDTTKKMFMSKSEARLLMLGGSTLLVGIK